MRCTSISQDGERQRQSVAPSDCKQIETLNLDGNLVGSEVLEELPQLKQLAIDNEFNKNPIRIDRLRSLEFLSVLKYGKILSDFRNVLA